MTAGYFSGWKETAIRVFAEEKRRTHGYSEEQALALSRESFDKGLAQGIETPNQHLFTVHADGVNGAEEIGFAWLSLYDDYGRRRAFVLDIEIHEAFRGKGYGRAAMLALEKVALAEGAEVIGLHVFAFNETAQRLYRSLDYHVTDLTMEKPL